MSLDIASPSKDLVLRILIDILLVGRERPQNVATSCGLRCSFGQRLLMLRIPLSGSSVGEDTERVKLARYPIVGSG